MFYPDYLQPKSLKEIFNNLPKDKKIYYLAGGTDLLNYLRDGLIDPKNSCIVDLSQVKELIFINETNENIEIGPMISFNILQENSLIKKHFPAITSLCKTFATPIISSQATVGGNIGNASPSGDSLPVFYTLNTKVEIQNVSQTRIEDIDKIFVGPKKTNFNNGDLITKIIVPKPFLQEGFSIVGIFKKIGGRKAHIISKVSLAITAILKDVYVQNITVAVGAVAPTVLKINKISEILNNQKVTKKLINICIDEIQKVISPIDDFRSTAKYRYEVIPLLFIEAMSELLKTNFYD
ncbi:MAG: FAD binding domain-containing protein [Endomicrobiia bacterium]